MFNWLRMLINWPQVGVQSMEGLSFYLTQNWGRLLVILIFVLVIVAIVKTVISIVMKLLGWLFK